MPAKKVNKKIKLTLMKSKYGRTKGHLECIHGLGLKRIRHSVIVDDIPPIRGMINKTAYLLKIEENYQ
jgi:large subunit ribosomal protein L30